MTASPLCGVLQICSQSRLHHAFLTLACHSLSLQKAYRRVTAQCLTQQRGQLPTP